MDGHLREYGYVSDITFERTYDKKFIRKCVTSPAVWRMSVDDTTSKINPELFFMPKNVPFYYLKVNKGYGLLIFEFVGGGVYEGHIALLPRARGRAIEICEKAVKWFFENEDCHTVRGTVPAFNNLAKRLAKHIGMESVGIREGAFLKDGIAHDLYIFEIRRS